MKHKCKVTVINKRVYPELQERYLADPESGTCPCFEVGDEFLFERADGHDDFWHFGRDRDPKFPCAEAWDCISRYSQLSPKGKSRSAGKTSRVGRTGRVQRPHVGHRRCARRT